jgi:hypothetical protein
VLGSDRKQFQLGGHSALAHGLQDPPRKTLFDRLHDTRRIAFLRFADQQMDGIGHDDVAYDHEAITLPDFFEHREEQIATLRAGQPSLPMITTASDEMQFIRALVASGMAGHKASLLVAAKKSCDCRPRRPPPLQKT